MPTDEDYLLEQTDAARFAVQAKESEIMTVDEVAAYLRVHISTAYKLAKRKQLPGFWVGGTWRIRKTELDEWIRAQQSPIPRPRRV